MSDPWKSLTQDAILNTVETVVGKSLANLILPRNSYINRVVELKVRGGEALIVKFYRPGRWDRPMIQDEHDLLFKLTNQDLPVIAPLIFREQSLFDLDGVPFAVFAKMGGRALDEFDQESWLRVGRLLGRIHALNERVTNASRVDWEPESILKQNMEMLISGRFLSDDYATSLARVMGYVLPTARRIYGGAARFLIHGDCHKGNLIHRPGEGIYLVDFDDCCIGPAVQDIWMLLPGDIHECERELAWFLEGYETFRAFERASLDLVPILKIMRIMHFAAWCAIQSTDLTFRNHFPDWGTDVYWGQLIRDIQSIVQAIDPS